MVFVLSSNNDGCESFWNRPHDEWFAYVLNTIRTLPELSLLDVNSPRFKVFNSLADYSVYGRRKTAITVIIKLGDGIAEAFLNR